MRGLKDKVTMRLAEEGCTVAIFDLKPEAPAETVAMAPAGFNTGYVLDVGDPAEVVVAVARVEAEVVPIWALVNNAGWDRPTTFPSTDQALWDKIIRINLYGPLNTHHAVAPLTVRRGGGRIINIASDAARVGTSNEAVYSVCEGGLISFTKSAARELASKGVRLNAVCPGPTNINADSENIRGISLATLTAVKLFYDTEESKEGVRAFNEKRKPDFHAITK